MPSSRPSVPEARYISPSELAPEVLKGLLPSFRRQGVSLAKLATAIGEGRLKLFDIHGGVLAVEVLVEESGRRTLEVAGFWSREEKQGWRLRSYMKFLQRLAAEWDCSRVEAAIEKPGLARVLQRLGCRQDYVAVGLELNNGQQEENLDQVQRHGD